MKSREPLGRGTFGLYVMPVLLFLCLGLGDALISYPPNVASLYFGALAVLGLLFLAGFRFGRGIVRVLCLPLLFLWLGVLVQYFPRVGLALCLILWSAVLAAFGLAVVLSFAPRGEL